MSLVAKVVRIPLPDDVAQEFAPFDYADVYEAHTVQHDARPCSEWLRSGFGAAPSPLRDLVVAIHRRVLRLKLQPGPSDFIGWTITKQDHDDFQLEAMGPLIRGRLVGRRIDSHTVRLCTFVTYRMRPAASIWALVGPIHRVAVPQLMKRAATSGSDASPHPVPHEGRR